METERLLIRPRSMADLEACLAIDRDPSVTRHVPGPWSNPDAHRAFVVARMQTIYPDGLGYWSVMDRTEPRRFLGWILLLPYREKTDEVEIGWRFVRANWGNGYATEAAAAILRHAFHTVGLEKVVADIAPSNVASIRVAEKLGMHFAEKRQMGGKWANSYQIRNPAACRPRRRVHSL